MRIYRRTFFVDIVGPNGDLTYSKIVIGADRNGKDGFIGAIGGSKFEFEVKFYMRMIRNFYSQITIFKLHFLSQTKTIVILLRLTGFHWNGKYPLQFVPVKDRRGTVEIVVTPIPDFPRPKPKPTCSNQFCGNGGRCYQTVDGLACNCSNTPFSGPQCNIRENPENRCSFLLQKPLLHYFFCK